MLNFTKRVVATTDNVISFTAFQGPQHLLSQLNLTWLISWLSLSLYLSTIQAQAGCPRHWNSFPSVSSL